MKKPLCLKMRDDHLASSLILRHNKPYPRWGVTESTRIVYICMAKRGQIIMTEQPNQTERDHILTTIKAKNVRFVNLEFTDVVGMAKCVTIPVEQFPDCLTHGKWFDGSAIEGFARIAERDMYLFPDLATFAILPGKVRPQAARTSQTLHAYLEQETDEDVVARVICDVRTPDSEHFDGDPRATLLRALQVAKSMGNPFFVVLKQDFFFFGLKTRRQLRLQPNGEATLAYSPDLEAMV